MLAFLQSLPPWSAVALVAGASAVVASVIGVCWRGKFAWVVVLLTSLAIAYCLYWLPFWLGADALEADSWAPLFIGIWFLAGAVASWVALLLVHILRRHKGAHV